MPIQLPTWSQTKTSSKQGFDKVYKVVDKLGEPINRLSHKVGSEAFWPTTLDKESEKAARILRSFCKDGFYYDDANDHVPVGASPKGKAKVVKKIPTEVIQKAKGLAIFTTMRTGLWVSGAGGSGVLIARTASGEWSPPSGIMLHTAGLGFLVGVDIYDCVVVINTEKALQAFTKIRCTLGGEISAVAGPVGIGGVLETEIHKRQAPVWNYLKSRGLYVGVQIDGTVIVERTDENERFYGERIAAADILAGKVRHPPYAIKTLMATIRAAQGDTDVDNSAMPTSPTPGDHEIHTAERSNSFGLPDADDPDPFGVHALLNEGFEIREAGTKSRPSTEAFEYKPSPTSPIFGTFGRHSLDGGNRHDSNSVDRPSSKGSNRRDSKRSSKQSISSIDRGTQTEPLGPAWFEDALRDRTRYSPSKKTTEDPIGETDGDVTERNGVARTESIKKIPEVDETHEATGQPVISRARLVTIPRRIPPALPPRNPYRNHVPIITNIDPVSSPTETSPSPRGLGLGVDLNSNSFQEEEDHEQSHSSPATGQALSPTKEDIDRKLDNLFLSPRTFDPSSDSMVSRDPDRLSSREKDGFDEISMSGSDYSHEIAHHLNYQDGLKLDDNDKKETQESHFDESSTPRPPSAIVPLPVRASNSPTPHQCNSDNPTEAPPDIVLQKFEQVPLSHSPSSHALDVDSSANNKNNSDNSTSSTPKLDPLDDLPGKFDEFHSVPSTPLEASQPVGTAF
ncbi:hypothetical protein MMC31_000887 [Peltigera leucophlebia]|nr:hypothetical protein [Peltigera leucophlebia]